MSALEVAKSAILADWRMPDRDIARNAGVAHSTVRRARARLEADGHVPKTPRLSDEQALRVPNPDHAWLPVVGWEARYSVSDHGAVRNIQTGLVLKPRKQTQLNYICYELHLDDRKENCYAHQLVARAFIGIPTGPLVRHLDDVKHNNYVGNLAYGDRRDNALDAMRNGLMPRRPE